MLRRALAALIVCAISGSAHGESAAPDVWSFAVTPYLWLPSVDGALRYTGPGGGPPNPEVGVDDKSLVDYLSGAFMIGGEVKKDRWLAVTDFIYIDFSNVGSHGRGALNTQTETSLTGVAWTLLGGYRTLEGPVEVDVLGGLRYFGLRTSTDWLINSQSRSASDSTEVWDGLFGVRGRFRVGQSGWYFPYYADIGAGASQLTWQAYGGAGYAFKWLDVSLIYRTIYYDERHDGLMDELSFTGPAAVFSIRF